LNQHVVMQREMLRLANVEVLDAIEDLLGQSGLNVDSRVALLGAQLLIVGAQDAASPVIRLTAILEARKALLLGSGKLGTNLSFDIGDGTVMF
jgi:hypothetical protein